MATLTLVRGFGTADWKRPAFLWAREGLRMIRTSGEYIPGFTVLGAGELPLPKDVIAGISDAQFVMRWNAANDIRCSNLYLEPRMARCSGAAVVVVQSHALTVRVEEQVLARAVVVRTCGITGAVAALCEP